MPRRTKNPPNLGHISPALRALAQPISALVEDPRNVNMHPDANIEAIEASLREFGQRKPIVVRKDGMTVTAGNGTLEAAKRLGWAHLAAVVLDDDEQTALRYAIADNRTAELAEWDEQGLADLLGELREDDALAGVGFDGADIDALLESLVNVEAHQRNLDKPQDVSTITDPVTKPGDVWSLGRHRLVCGDATSRQDVDSALMGRRVDLTLTDLPYGLGDSTTEKNNYSAHDDTVENLERLISEFLPIALDVSERVVLTPGNGNQHRYPTPTWALAWFTPAGVGRGPWGFCCWQPIICYGKDPRLQSGEGCHPDAIVHTESSADVGHPCPKPIKLWTWLLERASSKRGDVFDPFMGSGTTLLAAEILQRNSFGVEIDPRYCDLIVERWQELTGNKAVRG